MLILSPRSAACTSWKPLLVFGFRSGVSTGFRVVQKEKHFPVCTVVGLLAHYILITLWIKRKDTHCILLYLLTICVCVRSNLDQL
jgi:hypothetical protein